MTGMTSLGRKASRRGNSSLLWLLVLLLAALAAGLRWWNLGDLSETRKALESAGWAVAVLLLGGIFVRAMALLTAPSSSRQDRSRSEMGSAEPMRPEELAAYEAEVPEVEAPEVKGLKGTPPAELASALRSLAADEEK